MRSRPLASSYHLSVTSVSPSSGEEKAWRKCHPIEDGFGLEPRLARGCYGPPVVPQSTVGPGRCKRVQEVLEVALVGIVSSAGREGSVSWGDVLGGLRERSRSALLQWLALPTRFRSHGACLAGSGSRGLGGRP